VKSVRFFSDDPNEFSFFRGYPWEPLDEPNYDYIKLWLEHFEQNICSGNADLYNYLADWVAFIVKDPGQKTTTAPIFIGDHGCGKGDFFSIPLSKLFGKYSLKNVTKIDSITGKFNQRLENKVFVVCNEMQQSENSKFLNGDALKSIITERDIDYESKFVNTRGGECVANLMFFSNHELPIRLENGDRRYVVVKCSNKRCLDFKYFRKLTESMKHELFYPTLFTWFLNRDISKRDLREIPVTEAKEDMLQASKESWQLFFEDNIDEFVEGDGYVSKSCYEDYQDYCKRYGYAPYSLTKFGMKLKRFVDIIPRKREGKVVRYYKINNDGMKVWNKIQKEMEGMEEIVDKKKVRIDKDKKSKKEVKVAVGQKVNDKKMDMVIDWSSDSE
jgi:phage/plasmid-associated DNA primase